MPTVGVTRSSDSCLKEQQKMSDDLDASHNASQDSRFSCNICLEAVSEPVVTQCGHLYCWPCLYHWLEPGMLPAERQALLGVAAAAIPFAMNEGRRVCPVCKSPCSVPSVVPIYVRTHDDENNVILEEKVHEKKVTNIPKDESDKDDEVDSVTNEDQRLGEQTMSHASSTPQIDEVRPSGDDSSNQSITSSAALAEQRSPRSNALHSNNRSAVPARPAAQSPARDIVSVSPSTSATALTALQHHSQQRSNRLSPAASAHPASLTHGLALTFQQVLAVAVANANAANVENNNDQSYVPPLHRREGHGSNARANMTDSAMASNMLHPAEMDPSATEFLSRILLLLGSFVILCLLLF